MSGSSKSFNSATLVAARIAGSPNYVPAHIIPGGQKPLRQRCEFSVFQNVNDKTSKFKITAFGKMADVIAKSGATGKELTIIAKINSFQGRVPTTDAQGNTQFAINPSTGQPLTIEKTGFILESLSFGADSNKTIADEIQTGMRPPGWNIIGHADAEIWKNVCGQRNAQVFQNGQPMFGFARVSIPQGAQIVDPATINNMNTNYAGNTGTVTSGFQQSGIAAVVAPINPVQPVIVNGQNMGQAPMAANYNVPINNGIGAGQPVGNATVLM